MQLIIIHIIYYTIYLFSLLTLYVRARAAFIFLLLLEKTQKALRNQFP